MAVTLEHPYTELTGGRWLRGNLHTHTTASDGQRPAQDVIDDYADRGYDFLMISDHDVYTGPDAYARLADRGLRLIPGNEITGHGVHLLHVGAERRVAPHPQRQAVLQDIAAAGDGFVVVNHPNWQQRFDHCPIEKLDEWVGYAGLEIYNGTIGRLQGSPYATAKWDMLLAAGRRVWGFANDDHHLAAGDIEMGWNVAYVVGDTWRDVVEALRRGRFYASTGVSIERISVDGPTIRLETGTARRICALGALGRRIAQVDAAAIEIDAPDTEPYLRFECWGDGESFAWTQPFFTIST